MNTIFMNVESGRKNIGTGIGLFLLLGIVIGIPLTVDFLGGSMLTADQYQSWKVIHAYGVFLAFVNFFFGYCIDRLQITSQQKEIASWSFVIAGLSGGAGRALLFAFSILDRPEALAIALVETLSFVLGTTIFVLGLVKEQQSKRLDQPSTAVASTVLPRSK